MKLIGMPNWKIGKSTYLFFKIRLKFFLKSHIESGKLTLTTRSICLREEYIGSYDVDALDIILGDTKITLTPIGTNLIGAKGRVDMKGPRGTVKFVLVPKDSSSPSISIQVRIQGKDMPTKEETKPIADWGWKISTPPPRISYIELEEESFQTALMEVVNG
ncbi:hypothetical protein JYT13_01690 [Mariprofundus ferrooxydans]|nr:hypothetical protein [Mariprofundus ferrooxydans]